MGIAPIDTDNLAEINAFLRSFEDSHGEKKYITLTERMIELQERSLPVDFSDLEVYDPSLAKELLESPFRFIHDFEESIKLTVGEIDPLYLQNNRIHVRFTNPPQRVMRALRKIRSSDIGRFIGLEAIVTKSTTIRPLLTKALFRCMNCGNEMERLQDEGRYNPPFTCINETCGKKGPFKLLKEESIFEDWQKLIIQERPEELPAGQMPESFVIYLLDDLVDRARPGDRILITGILDVRPAKRIQRGDLPTFINYIESNSIKKEIEEYSKIEITEEDEKEIIAISKLPNIHDRIRNSIAPAIHGYNDIKEAIALLLFGGATKTIEDGTKLRGESNVLIIGDPGMGKCVHPDTEIILNSGQRTTIYDLVDTNIEYKNQINNGYFEKVQTNVMGMNLSGKTFPLTSNVQWKGKAPKSLVTVKTLSGRKITVTPSHPFFTCDQGSIVPIKAEELEIGQYLAVPRKLHITGNDDLEIIFRESKANNAVKLNPPAKLTNWFAFFLGLVIGEGFSQNRENCATISFTNNNEKLLYEYKKCLDKLGVNYTQRTKHINNSASEVYCCSSELYSFLENIDPSIVKRSAYKRVPNPIMRSSDIIVSHFLRALFDGEAHISKKLRAIRMASASYKLLSDVQTLLLRFEIIGNIKEKVVNGKTYFRINITGLPNIRAFAKHIGFTIDYKLNALENHINSDKEHNTNIDIVPNVAKILRTLRTKSHLLQKDFGIPRTTYMHYERGDRNPSRKNLQKIVQVLKKNLLDSNDLDRLEKLAYSDVHWDCIIDISKENSSVEWVYDLQVPEVHNFIANGFFVHNSQILRYIADLAPRAIFTSGKGSSAAGLCVTGDSRILFSDSINKIGEIVDEEFESGEIYSYNENMEYKQNFNSNNHTFHSKDLKLHSQKIDRFWRIKSPKNLIKIKSKTGKEIELTPETSILSLDNELGLVWKPAKLFKENDVVALTRKLPINCKKELNSIYDYLGDYPGSITLLDVENTVLKLIDLLKKKMNLSVQKIARNLEVSDDSIYNWCSKDKRGSISLINFDKLCKLVGTDTNSNLPDILRLQVKKGQTISLPRNFDESWFCLLGLLFGDGRISIDKREDGYGGVTIGLANRDSNILRYFEDFFTSLGFKITKSEGNDERASEYRIWSKLIYHIFSKFGLHPSPKSKHLTPNSEVLFLERKYLYSFLRGLFDADGWIFTRKNGSSHIGFASISKNLIEFVQNGLLTLDIITYVREINPKITVTSKGKKIISKNIKYELTFSNFNDIKKFMKNINFLHPKKREKLSNYCKEEKISHKNDDNIPKINSTLNELFKFYNYSSREIFGYKKSFNSTEKKKSISRDKLEVILNNITPDRSRCKVKLSDEFRYSLYEEMKKIMPNKINKITRQSKEQIYEYFIRKGRNPWIPIVILERISKNCSNFNETIKIKLSDIIKENIWKNDYYLEKYNLLRALSNSDVFWDKIIKIETIKTQSEFVYDLTIPDTHNFIVNNFVVHNTAAVVRDPDTGEMSLEAGALVLADKGVALIDEFDKMRREDRSALHEAMEQHSISVAKAGIVATLNARTSILAAANPRQGRWDPTRDLSYNINLPPTLISRFDLIFPLIDKPDLEDDRKKATHILSLHQDSKLPTEPPINKELLRKYIAYARQKINPSLTEEARESMMNFYLQLREQSKNLSEEGQTATIAITPRQLEALVRLSEARAKSAHRTKVLREDADAAIRLMESTMRKIAFDPETGTYDSDILTTGRSSKTRNKLLVVTEIIEKLAGNTNEPIDVDEIIDAAKKQNLKESEVEDAIDALLEDGYLLKPIEGKVRKV